MFTVKALSKTIIRPSQLTVLQRTISSTTRLPARCKGSEDRMKNLSDCSSKQKKKTQEEECMEKFKECSERPPEFSCKDATSEITEKVTELEKEMHAMKEIQKIAIAAMGPQKCPQTKGTPYKCDLKPPKKPKEDHTIPYLIGLIVALAGAAYLFLKNKKDEEKKDEKKDEKKEDKDEEKKEK